MSQVTVPVEVAKALDELYKISQWNKPDDINLLLLMIPNMPVVVGPAVELKLFAREHPTTYIQAIANGYIAKRNLHQEVSDMINDWMNEPYVGNTQKDIEMFAKRLIDKLQKQL